MTPQHDRSGGARAAADAVAAEAEKLVDGAARRDIVLRVVGGVGVWLSVDEVFRDGLIQGQRNFEDIDLVCRSRDRRRLPEVMQDLGYHANKRFNALHGQLRHIYERDDIKVDVFFDRIDMCHTVDFAASLRRGGKAAAPVDLLLHKLQIVEINHKDLLDAGALLGQFDDDDGISVAEIDAVLSADWGFWYTATTNLQRLLDHMPHWTVWPDDVKRIGQQRAEQLLQALQDSPKSARWKMRARIGTKMRWYQEVEEV